MDDQTTLQPVLIVPIDGLADRETPPIAAMGRDFHGLPVRHAMPGPGGGDVAATGGLRVTGLRVTLPPDVARRGAGVLRASGLAAARLEGACGMAATGHRP